MKLLVIGKEGKLQKNSPDPSVYADFEIVYAPLSATDEEVLAIGGDAEYILADAIGRVSANVINNMPNLKIIHSEGVGYNKIDVAAAKEKHVYVCNCKGMNATAVAEQAILLMSGLLRGVCTGDAAVRAGKQIDVKNSYMMNASLKELRDCRIGLLGFGDIAKETAKLAKAYGCEIWYYDIFRPSAEVEAMCGAEYHEMDELLAGCDIVSIHLPVLPSTENMANKEFFAKMKDGSYFINTARGELVDEEALLDALRSGKLAGAGLDVITGEPVQADHPMLHAEPEVEAKIIYSAHIGGITASSFRRGYAMVWADFNKVKNGERPDHIVNAWD